MNTRNTPLSLEEKEEIKRVYLEIGNQAKVAKITKHSIATVWKTIRSYGLNKGQGGNPHYSITDEQILKGISDGLTRQEIADKYGTHVENLARRMRSLGVHAKYAKSQKQIEADTWHYTESAEAFIKDRQPDFDFVSIKRERYRLRCKKCGSKIERNRSTIRRSKCRCTECKKMEQEQEELNKLRSAFIGEYRKCSRCGEMFFALYKTSAYCSERCKRKAKTERRKERDPEWKPRASGGMRKGARKYIERAKKYNCQYEYGITLRSVYKRDGGICKICGQPCDLNDKSYGQCGPNYPSVDHIIPLSKGGSHTWDNVQLAHMICNSYKGIDTR